MATKTGYGEVLPPGMVDSGRLNPRFRGGGGAFRDENLDMLSRVLDTWFRVPGTSIRFGLDGIIGFVPGIGDFLGGLASCIIVLAAFFRGVPLVTIARMVANLGIEVGIGAIPFAGNLFDIAWRANRRNYALLTGSLEEPDKHRRRSWWFLAALCVVLAVLLVLPTLLFAWVALHVLQGVFGFNIHGINGWL